MMRDKDYEFQEWIQLYSQSLLNKALYLLSDKNDAEDIVQEVFMSAYLSFESFSGKSSPSTWLQSILRNKIADFYREKYKSPINFSISQFFDENGAWKDESVTNIWEEPSDNDFEIALHNCIEKLPLRWKIPVKLYYLKQKKNEEVCQEMGITPTNLWKILQRSRLQLRECLETNWFRQ